MRCVRIKALTDAHVQQQRQLIDQLIIQDIEDVSCVIMFSLSLRQRTDQRDPQLDAAGRPTLGSFVVSSAGFSTSFLTLARAES